MTQSTNTLRIDVTADVVCPWCLIGTRRLDRALSQQRDLTVDLVYHPFLVQRSEPPTAAPLERRPRGRSKYGNPEPLLRRMEAVARADGIDLDMSRVASSQSTVGAHTLLRHARERGSQRALARALFGAHFLEAREIGSESVLETIARSHGFAAGEASALLRDPREAAVTTELAQRALEGGIAIAPQVVLAGRITVVGAQPLEAFRVALERARALS